MFAVQLIFTSATFLTHSALSAAACGPIGRWGLGVDGGTRTLQVLEAPGAFYPFFPGLFSLWCSIPVLSAIVKKLLSSLFPLTLSRSIVLCLLGRELI